MPKNQKESKRNLAQLLGVVATTGIFASTLGGCARKEPSKAESPQQTVCREITGKPWVPQTGAPSPSPEVSSFQFVTENFHFSAPVVGATQGFSSAQTVTFEFEMQEPLGAGGELSLTAHLPFAEQERSENFRPDTVHPLLISLWDGKHEWVGMDSIQDADRADSADPNDCHSKGILKILDDGNVVTRSGCVPVSKNGSAFFSPRQWFSKQFSAFGGVSFNQFPTCDWSFDQSDSNHSSEAKCSFNDRIFQRNHELRSGAGVKYRATYLVLNSALAHVGSEARLGLNISVQKKITDPELRQPTELPQSGQVDLNIILVGQDTIQGSRTEAGGKILQSIFDRVQEIYAQPNARIQIGRTQSYEWHCDNGGEPYAQINIAQVGNLFDTGSQLIQPTVPPGSALRPAVNLFLLGSVLTGDEGSPLQLRGFSGGIGGPAVQGTRSSGVVIAMGGILTGVSPKEALRESKRESLEVLQLSDALAHETGHFLGLNHLSERAGKTHDPIPDTPKCSETEVIQEMHLITDRSCRKERTPLITTGKSCAELCSGGSSKKCPEVEECAFNHVMWWVEKSYRSVSGVVEGDGHLFSPLSGRLLRYSPFVY